MLSKTSIPPCASQAGFTASEDCEGNSSTACICRWHIQLLVRVLKEKITSSMASINTHFTDVFVLPLGSVLQNPFLKKGFGITVRSSKLLNCHLFLPVSLGLTPFPNFRFLNSRQALVYVTILIFHGALLNVCMFRTHMRKTHKCNAWITTLLFS